MCGFLDMGERKSQRERLEHEQCSMMDIQWDSFACLKQWKEKEREKWNSVRFSERAMNILMTRFVVTIKR